jgi:hypothetical protein
VTTGEIVAVGAAVTILGGGVLFVLHRQNAAALQAQAAAQAAAARAATSAKTDFDLGGLLVKLGGSVVDKAIPYIFGGPAGVAAAEAANTALRV